MPQLFPVPRRLQKGARPQLAIGLHKYRLNKEMREYEDMLMI